MNRISDLSRHSRFRGIDGGWAWLVALVLFLLAAPASAQTFPALSGRVVDQAELLSPAQEAELSARSAALERRTSDQLVIATVSSLAGQPIERYAQALGNHWRVGQRGRNNGVLIVVAPTERRARIAVGDGLLRALPDRESQRIMTRMVSAFRDGRWFDGVDRGSRDIVARLTASPGWERRR